MTDYRCMFSTSDRHRKLNQLRWQNMSAHLTNETPYWLKKLLMHLNWAIYIVYDLNIDPHVCFFPTLSQDRDRPIPLALPEACPQRSERPVRSRSPHRSRNGYPGCIPYHRFKCCDTITSLPKYVYMIYIYIVSYHFIPEITLFRKLYAVLCTWHMLGQTN